MEKESVGFIADILTRLKTEGITLMDVVIFIAFIFAGDLFFRRERSMIMNIFNYFFEYILKIIIQIKSKNPTEESIKNKKISNGPIIDELLRDHFVHHKLENFPTDLISQIRTSVKYWSDNKFNINFPGNEGNFIEKILKNDQYQYADLFYKITNKHLRKLSSELSQKKAEFRIEQGSIEIPYNKDYADKIQSIFNSHISDYKLSLNNDIIYGDLLKDNETFHSIVQNQVEILIKIITCIFEKVISKQISDSVNSVLNVDLILKKYYESILIQVDFLIHVISNDIKCRISQKIQLDTELEKLIAVLRNESIDIVSSFEEMLKLQDIDLFNIAIIDLRSPTKFINKSFINITGINKSIKDWTELKPFLETIDLDFINDKYHNKGE